MRWLILLLLVGVALSCIGTGYTCDRGGIEIHLKVNKEIINKYFERADVIPYGQTWGVKGRISVYYTNIYPVLLYVFDNGIRIQIAIKNFSVNEDLFRESCEFWEDPKNLDAKEVTRKILRRLKEIGAIEVDDIEKIVEKARWGCSGNCWIDVERNVTIALLRGCGGGGVFILKEWKEEKVEEKKKSIFERILTIIIEFLKKIILIFKK